MRFVKDRCVTCGNPAARPKDITAKYKSEQNSAGRLDYMGYWFCSDDCYEKAFGQYLPAEFAIGKTLEDSPEYKALKKEIVEEATEEGNPVLHPRHVRTLHNSAEVWRTGRDYAFSVAIGKLNDRIRAEYMADWHKSVEQTNKGSEEFRIKQDAKELAEKVSAEFWEKATRPRPIPEHFLYEHAHIVGASGSGKSTLIQQIILDHLAKDDPPALVIIDPKGLMVHRIAALPIFTDRLKDRLVIIDPTREPLPSLGLFDLPPGKRFRNKLVEFFEYIFSTSEAQITQRQSVPFRFVIRLVLSMGGDLDTLMDIFEEGAKSLRESRFRPDIEKLAQTDGGARRFFANDFFSPTFAPTRDQLRTRLYQIISSPTLMQMFCTKECHVSFTDCLQQRKIVLINTGMNDFEKKDSQLIGRYAISMTLAAAFSRADIPREQWTPAFLFIDEFQEFADKEKTPELLRLAREYKLGVTIAHQNMFCEEFSDSIRGAISTNTSIKYAASVEAQDFAYVQRDLQCRPEFLRSRRVTDTHVNFACYVRNFTDVAMAVSVLRGNIQDAQPRLIEEHEREAFKPPLADLTTDDEPPGMTAFHTIEAFDKKSRAPALKEDDTPPQPPPPDDDDMHSQPSIKKKT